MKKRKLYILLFLLLFFEIGYGQDSLVQLKDYLMYAIKNNPELKTAYYSYMASLEKVPQVKSLPDPKASIGIFPRPMQLLPGNQIANIQVMQMFPWFGTLKASENEAIMRAKAKYDIFNSKKAKLFFEIKSSWHTLQKIQYEIQLVKENITLLESLEKLALVKLESAKNSNSSMKNATMPSMTKEMKTHSSGLPFVLRIKIELLDMQNHLLLLDEKEKTEQIKINALLNRSITQKVIIQDSLTLLPLPSNKESLLDSILTNNSMLSMYKNEILSYSFMEDKAKKIGLPMLGVGINYMLINERTGVNPNMNGMDMFMPMLSLSMPLYRKKYQSMQKEASYMKQSAQQKNEQWKNTLQVKYHTLIQTLDDSKRKSILYKEQVELAKKTLDILSSGLEVSTNNYEEILTMQQKILDYGFKYVESVINYNITVAELEQLMNFIKYE